MSNQSSVNAMFDNEDKYDKFVKNLKNPPIQPLGEWEITPDIISYNPGITVTITCEEEDVDRISRIIEKHGKCVF